MEDCGERTLWLLRHPEEREAFSMRGGEIVRERFLLTRLIADELRLYSALLGVQSEAITSGSIGLGADGYDC